MVSPSPEKKPDADTNAPAPAPPSNPAPKPKPKPKTWNLKTLSEYFGTSEDEVYAISAALTHVMTSRSIPDKTLQTKVGKAEIESFLRANLGELPGSVRDAGYNEDQMEALKGLFCRIRSQRFQYLLKTPAKGGERSGSAEKGEKNAAGDGKGPEREVKARKDGSEKEEIEKDGKTGAKDAASEEDDLSEEYETEEDEEEPKESGKKRENKNKDRASVKHVVNTSNDNASETSEETSETDSDTDTNSEEHKPEAAKYNIIFNMGKKTLLSAPHHSSINTNTPETTTMKTIITTAPSTMESTISEPQTKRVKLFSRSDRILDLLLNGTIWALNEPHPNAHGIVSIHELLAKTQPTDAPKVTDLDFQALIDSLEKQCGYVPSLHRLEYRAPEKVLPFVGGEQVRVPVVTVEQWRAVLKAHAASGVEGDPVFHLVEKVGTDQKDAPKAQQDLAPFKNGDGYTEVVV